jgi:diphthamide biosynthesis protein 2
VDAVAAEHYEADSLVHFGHSCLSLVDKIPVFYVFEKFPLDLNALEVEVNKLAAANKPGQKLVVLYDVEYAYLFG